MNINRAYRLRFYATAEHAWLNEVSNVPVQQALRHLNTAFTNFFAQRARYRAFRRKHGPHRSNTPPARYMPYNPTTVYRVEVSQENKNTWLSFPSSLSLPKGKYRQMAALISCATKSNDTENRITA